MPDSLLLYSNFYSFLLELLKIELSKAKIIHADYLHNSYLDLADLNGYNT